VLAVGVVDLGALEPGWTLTPAAGPRAGVRLRGFGLTTYGRSPTDPERSQMDMNPTHTGQNPGSA
jgi:hypothetical protein